MQDSLKHEKQVHNLKWYTSYQEYIIYILSHIKEIYSRVEVHNLITMITCVMTCVYDVIIGTGTSYPLTAGVAYSRVFIFY